MQVAETTLPGVLLLQPERFSDERGWFVENWSHRTARQIGLDVDFVQDNLSVSLKAGTVRGLHYQRPPFAQAKLLSVLRGRILDVVVDLRRDSPYFGHHLTRELSVTEGTILFVPAGFAHGFCTLEDDTMVAYKVDAPYAPTHDAAIHWQDLDLAIDWPVAADHALLSPKDLAAGPFKGRDHGF